MEKNIYTVMYFGNAKKYQDLRQEIAAYSKRHAVEMFYEKMLNLNYFPEDEFTYGGLVKDCDGNVIAEIGSVSIEYDGGYFYAELKIVE
jgi:MoaA/NifB/PqqE/SkfB family radical SAM enzyme